MKDRQMHPVFKIFPDVLVFVSQIRCGARPVTLLPTDSYPRACATNLSHISHVSSVDAGPLARVSRGVLAPDCVVAFHFLLLHARRTDFLVAACAPGRNFKYRILSLLESVFTTGPSNNLGNFSAFSHNTKPSILSHKRTGQGSCWIENFADLPENEEKLATYFGVPEGNYPESLPMRTAYPSIT